MAKYILTINGGSSSIKFSVYDSEQNNRLWQGHIERIGLTQPFIAYSEGDQPEVTNEVDLPDHPAAAQLLLQFLRAHINFDDVAVIGHRVVHGMHLQHSKVTPELIAELKTFIPIDPQHLPPEIALIELFAQEYPNLMQVAAFDTAFHADMPRLSKIIALPRKYEQIGVRRYGFHGLSLAFLLEELGRIDPAAAAGRVIMCHLGNGASVTAVRDGKSFDTSMGFSPVEGLAMSTRTGDIDPSALLYVMGHDNLSIDDAINLVNKQSGLLGVSEISSDMLDLLRAEGTEPKAKETIDYFCYNVKKKIGAYAAALGGVETIVFSASMAVRSALIRRRICEGLQFLGIELDEERNNAGGPVVSPEGARVTIRVMHTDEERMIARIAGTFAGVSLS